MYSNLIIINVMTQDIENPMRAKEVALDFTTQDEKF